MTTQQLKIDLTKGLRPNVNYLINMKGYERSAPFKGAYPTVRITSQFQKNAYKMIFAKSLLK